MVKCGMAITKIWAVKSRLNVSLNYIENPEKTTLKPDINAIEGAIKYIQNKEKTENCVYVKAYKCSKERAYVEMIETQEFFGKSNRKNGILAFHLVQSFKDFETTPEIAHKCGKELVERLFADKYETIIATHLDYDYLHNHIIINSVSYIDGHKYRNSYKDYFHDIRGISDKICIENCLSVIEYPKGRGKHYAEWKAAQEGRPTIRGQIKDELDEIIKCSYTYQSFWKILQERGYKVKRNVKYIALKPANSKRYIRLKSLGENYSEEAIQNRIRMARNGIKPLDEKKDYNTLMKKYEPKKLRGFKALYFHYLYLFGKVSKKETPQRVSFYMREELIKFERYQKQFHFLIDNNIETVGKLEIFKDKDKSEIAELTAARSKLYDKLNGKDEILDINAKLIKLRKDIRMCDYIFADAERIKEQYENAQRLENEAHSKNKKEI